MGAAGGAGGTWRHRRMLAATAAACTAIALLAHAARQPQLGLLRPSQFVSHVQLQLGEEVRDCGRWQSAGVLGGGCLAELPQHAANFECCGGQNYTCHSSGYACPAEALLPALRCVSPRHMLLGLPPGCSLHGGGSAAAPTDAHAAQLRVPLQQCLPSAEGIATGRWVEIRSPAGPGVPSLRFQPGCSPASGSGQPFLRARAPRPPLAGPAALQRLWGAGFDRVVISGDSTVRHLYNRLVA